MGHGDRQRAPRRGAASHPHSTSRPSYIRLDWDSGHGGSPSSTRSSASHPLATQFTGRGPKRGPAPGKLRDPVSAASYWQQLNGHADGPGAAGAAWQATAGWVGAAAAGAGYHDGVPACYSPAGSWYGGPGGGDSNSPPARTNGNNNSNGNGSTNSRTATPTTTAASDNWSEAAAAAAAGANGPPPLRPGIPCSWEWWPPDPPEEWALSNAPWEPPPAPPVNGYSQHSSVLGLGHRHETSATNGHDHAHEGRTASGVW